MELELLYLSYLNEFTEEQSDENQGVVYYRVKQTDFDGEYDYTPIRAVNFDKTLNRFYFDNQSNNLSIYNSQDADYAIYSTSGALVRQGVVQNDRIDISANDLPHSVYVVKVQNAEDKVVDIFKFSVD